MKEDIKINSDPIAKSSTNLLKDRVKSMQDQTMITRKPPIKETNNLEI